MELRGIRERPVGRMVEASRTGFPPIGGSDSAKLYPGYACYYGTLERPGLHSHAELGMIKIQTT